MSHLQMMPGPEGPRGRGWSKIGSSEWLDELFPNSKSAGRESGRRARARRAGAGMTPPPANPPPSSIRSLSSSPAPRPAPCSGKPAKLDLHEAVDALQAKFRALWAGHHARPGRGASRHARRLPRRAREAIMSRDEYSFDAACRAADERQRSKPRDPILERLDGRDLAFVQTTSRRPTLSGANTVPRLRPWKL